jgi:hypothetical protein
LSTAEATSRAQNLLVTLPDALTNVMAMFEVLNPSGTSFESLVRNLQIARSFLSLCANEIIGKQCSLLLLFHLKQPLDERLFNLWEF